MSPFDDDREIQETTADPDGLNRTVRESANLQDSRTHAQEQRPVKRIGPYRLVRELARGGMGAVHEVIDERNGQHQALKTIRADLTDLETLDRFRREAQLTAQLDHPNVARLHHAQLDTDPCYLVQDLLTGGTLEHRLRAGPLPPPEARQIAIELGRGLAHAHGLGILHRDLSPRNVMFDAAGRPKIVDFGLARSLATWQRLTMTGQLLGTPAFMAPEQAIDAKSADARSDVYGLGGLLYTMLTGAALIPADVKTIPAAVEALQRWTPPAPRALNPQVPPDLDAICMRALAKDPLRRFSSMAAMVAALSSSSERESDSHGGGALPASPPAGWLQVALVAAVVALAITLGFVLGRGDPPPTTGAAPPVAQTPTPAATPEPTTTAPAPADRPWLLQPKQKLTHHLTHWLDLPAQGVLASLGLMLQLEVKTVGPKQVRLEGRIVRIRYWVHGPYLLRFDSNRPRVSVDPTGEAQRALRAALNRPFKVTLDPRRADSLRFHETSTVLQEPVATLSPKSQAPYDRGWALNRLVETLGGEALKRFFRGPRLRFEQGRPVSNHREEEKAIERLEQVELYTIASGDTLIKICSRINTRPDKRLERIFVGDVSARNRIEAPSKIRLGDVIEIPPRAPTVPNPKVIALLKTRPLQPPLIFARPWGVVLAEGRSGWAFAALREEGPWVQIQWGGGSAWVRKQDTRPETKAQAFVVTADALWVRSFAKQTQTNQLGQVQNGQVYVAHPLRVEGIWIPIRFDEREPFVARRYLRPLPR